jgi:DNA polymerase-4
VTGEPWVARSRSKEVTFTRDLTEPEEIAQRLATLAADVTAAVVAEGRAVTHVAVKLRTASFVTRTRIAKLPAPTTDPAEVATMARKVLGRFPTVGAVRLLGARVMLQMPRDHAR